MKPILLLTALAISANTFAFLGYEKRVNQNEVYTLYRNSILDEYMRIHVATYDSKDGDKYNRINCTDAIRLRMGQKGVETKFWCEKGYFKK